MPSISTIETASQPLLPETAPEEEDEEGDWQILKRRRLCGGNIHFQSSHWSSEIM